MENRVAIIGIFIEQPESAVLVNELLHEYSDSIVGRLGLPYRNRGIHIISIIVDADSDRINSLAGKLGKIPGITAKAMQSKI